VLLLFLYVPYGTVVAFIPIIASSARWKPGTFCTIFALAVLLIRAKAAGSDRRGRGAVILPGMLVAAIAFAVLGLTSGPIGVLAGAAIYGVAFGAVQPALMALTADRVPLTERGKAMGTFYAAWELGITTGAVASGLLLKVTDFPVMLLWSSAMPACGALLSLKARSSPLPRVTC
jgi:MFS family permease